MRRAIVGAIAAGARSFRYMPDTHGISQAAVGEFGDEAEFVAIDAPTTASAIDTRRAAGLLREEGCAAVLTLGGDGTNRAFAQGWRDAPLIPVSTGTNNVFPTMVEGTVAGAAAGLVASGAVPLEDVARQVKAIAVTIDGEGDDLALIDAVLAGDRFVGSRALWGAERLRLALLTRAEPWGVGITSIGGLLRPLTDEPDEGLLLRFGTEAEAVRAPIAPGLYEPVGVESIETVAFNQVVELEGPGVLAFDGERERVLKPGQRATLQVARDGPWVIDVHAALTRAACDGFFRIDQNEGSNAN